MPLHSGWRSGIFSYKLLFWQKLHFSMSIHNTHCFCLHTLICTALFCGLLLFFQPLFAQTTAQKQAAQDRKNLNEAMVLTAKAWLQSLTPAQTAKARFPFHDAERTNWNNLPPQSFTRNGLQVSELEEEQLKAFHQMLRAGLSQQGYLKAMGIISRELVFRQQLFRRLAPQDTARYFYGPTYYWVSIFGEPDVAKPWGWRFEGHHLSLNFTLEGDRIDVTPTFWGVNPSEIEEGPYVGTSIMYEEQHKIRSLIALLSPKQQALSALNYPMPNDIEARTGNEPYLASYHGLPYKQMEAAQQEKIDYVIAAYLQNFTRPIALAYEENLTPKNKGELHFTWALSENGSLHYRIHGPGLLIELNNRTFEPNHIHSVWRAPGRDFGRKPR
jgi:hypothetical protein